MHTLQEFVLKRVVPAVEVLSRARNDKELSETSAYASVFESFLWLHLGTEVGVFPLEASREVFSTYYAEFFRSLNREQDKRLDQVAFRSRLYVYDTPESTELKATFSDFTILIEQAMRGQDAFNVQRNEFHDPIPLRPAFRNFLRLASSLGSDPLVQRFTDISQFADTTKWEKEWHTSCTPEQVAIAGEGDREEVPPRAVIYAGFLRLWSYSYQLREMSDMYATEEIRTDDLFRLLDRVKSTLRWRINLRSREVANRLESVRGQLKKQLDDEASGMSNLRSSVDFIKDSMDTAFEIWLVPMTATV